MTGGLGTALHGTVAPLSLHQWHTKEWPEISIPKEGGSCSCVRERKEQDNQHRGPCPSSFPIQKHK